MFANALAQRVVTAAVLLAFLLPAFLLLPVEFGIALIGVFVIGGAWEWSAFFLSNGSSGRIAYVGLLALMLAGASWATPSSLPIAAVTYAALLWWLVAFLWLLRFPTPIRRSIVALCGLLVLVPAGVSLISLLRAESTGRYLLLLALVIVWAADAGAFFVGRRLGRVKLAPRVSPGKTWEGVLGGLLMAVLAATAGAVVLGYPLTAAVPVGLSVAALSVVGDLTVSMFKRNAGLKDSGQLLPGHGGVLDRVDSLAAAMPLFVLEVSWLGWIGESSGA
jgi:phosphatidate cytidylyltransferase